MKALLLTQLHAPLEYAEVAEPDTATQLRGSSELPRSFATVALRAAALNHRDVYIQQGLYSKIQLPVILGSDGAGVCEGREVIINPGSGWGDDPRCQAKTYQILGMPANGTFCEKICLPADRLVAKPAHLSWPQAAALPLAGLTAYRALFSKCQLLPGEKVLVSGIGGGVALMAMQFALAARAEVWVTSGSTEKLERAVALGATGGALYKNADWEKEMAAGGSGGGFDVVVDSAGGEGFEKLVRLCRPGARIALYGGTQGPTGALSPQVIFWKQISLFGTTMGTDAEFEKMVAFVAEKKIVPVVDSVFPLAEGNAAFERMARGEQFGKIVLES